MDRLSGVLSWWKDFSSKKKVRTVEKRGAYFTPSLAKDVEMEDKGGDLHTKLSANGC